MAEAPESRTQPSRSRGKQPVLKTGRATGPRSLPTKSLGARLCDPASAGFVALVRPRYGRRRGGAGSSATRGAGLMWFAQPSAALAFDQANLARPRTLGRFLGHELDPLTFSQ